MNSGHALNRSRRVSQQQLRTIRSCYREMILDVLGEGPVCLFIYGSVARGEARECSDIDVCCVVNDISRRDRMDIRAGAVRLHRKFAFVADNRFPIEIFCRGWCERVVNDICMHPCAQTARTRDANAKEFINALFGTKSVISGHKVLLEWMAKIRRAGIAVT